MTNISVIESKELSAPYQKRYVVINKDTGEILDDAQGYGYKTPQKAYAAYDYKNTCKKKRREKLAKERHIRQWLKERRCFSEMMAEANFRIAKGEYGPDAKFNAAFVKEMLAENNIEIDFMAGELLRVWSKS